MSTYLVTTFEGDPDDGEARVMDGDGLDTLLADYRSRAVRDGEGIMIRKADYLERPVFERAVEAAPVRHLRLVHSA
jgi:hypothetical protein